MALACGTWPPAPVKVVYRAPEVVRGWRVVSRLPSFSGRLHPVWNRVLIGAFLANTVFILRPLCRARVSTLNCRAGVCEGWGRPGALHRSCCRCSCSGWWAILAGAVVWAKLVLMMCPRNLHFPGVIQKRWAERQLQKELTMLLSVILCKSPESPKAFLIRCCWGALRSYQNVLYEWIL